MINKILDLITLGERKQKADERLRCAAEFCREWDIDIPDSGEFNPAFFNDSTFWGFLEALGYRDAVYRQPQNEHLSWNRWYKQGYEEGLK